MIHVLYTLLLWTLAPLILIYHVYRSVSRGRSPALAERFGFIRDDVLAPLQGREVIWVHAVSVGETIAVTPLVKELKRRWPDKRIVLSNVTETGREVAGKVAEVDCRIYFPFDYPNATSRLLRKISPSLVIMAETEIWPNFIRTARKMAIPVVMVNGRISDRSLGRYLRLRWFFRPVLRDFARLCMQTSEDARRIIEIGAEPEKVVTCRNLKYDIICSSPDPFERNRVRSRYGIPADATIITAGSTHAGEEEAVVSLYTALLRVDPAAFLVLVPRHPERAGDVAAIVKKGGIPFTLRSELEKRHSAFEAGEVLLVDRVGELNALYSLSDVVFVGGSLVPTGGHNVLEPVSFGVPVLFGPHMQNFREIAALVTRFGAGVQVADARELQQAVMQLVQDAERRSAMGKAGFHLLEECAGATEAHVNVLQAVLEEEQGVERP